MSINVREAGLEDIDEISSLINEIVFPVGNDIGKRVHESHRDVKKRIKDENCVSLVAETEGQIIGHARGVITHNEVRVERVVVAEPYQGKGIGTKILTELERLLLEYKTKRGLKSLLSYALIEWYNSASYSLFKKIGYDFGRTRDGGYKYHQAHKRL